MNLGDILAVIRLLDDKSVVNGVPFGQLKKANNVLRVPLPIDLVKKQK